MNSRERLSPTDRPHIAASDPYLDFGPPLPERYGVLTLRALVRDPRSVFAYWEWPDSEKSSSWTVRLRDVATSAATIATLDRAAAASGAFYFDASPERDYEVDLGWTSGDIFVVVRTSNRIRTPREGPATEIDPEWVPIEGEADVWRTLSGPQARTWIRGGAYRRGGPSHD